VFWVDFRVNWGSQMQFLGSQGGFTYKNARKMGEIGWKMAEIEWFSSVDILFKF
jgi:hypothetical protein